MEEKIIKFYRQIVFGRKFGLLRHSKNMEYDIKSLCFITAWNDMSRHQKNISKQYEMIAEDLGCRLKYNKKNEIINRDELIQCFFEKSISYLDTMNSIFAIKGIDNSVSKHVFEIGKIQKIVNMYYKYLYTFCLYLSDIEHCLNYKEGEFKNCDCPIDNYILDALYDKNIINATERKNITWSVMDYSTYSTLQKKIKNYILANTDKYHILLDFDFENFGE